MMDRLTVPNTEPTRTLIGVIEVQARGALHVHVFTVVM